MSNRDNITNTDISKLIYEHGITIEKLQGEINNLKKLVYLAIVTNLPQLMKILTG